MVQHCSSLLLTRIRTLSFCTTTYFIACMMRTSHIPRTSTIRRPFLSPPGSTHKSSSTSQTWEVSKRTSRISRKSQRLKMLLRSQRNKSSRCLNNRLRHVLIGKVSLSSCILRGKKETSICKDRWRGLKVLRLQLKQLQRWLLVQLSPFQRQTPPPLLR